MKSGYYVRSLDREDALYAYGLIQSVWPNFPGEDWLKVVAPASRWTVVSITDPSGYVRGLAAYRIGTHPVADVLMDVPIFVVGSVMNEDAVASILFKSLQSRSTACGYMRLWAELPISFSEMNSEDRFRRWDHGLMFRVDQKPFPALL